MLNFREKLQAENLLILDSAMGTELEKRGVDTDGPAWSAKALINAPDMIEQIHYENILAGADIITSNSFRTHQRSLGQAGISTSAFKMTRLAVNIARKAIDKSGREVFLAGSISPLEDCYSPELVPKRDDLIIEHSLNAENLATAGVDLLLIETMNSIREAVAAAEAAAKTGLPFGVSFVCNDEALLLSGESLREAVNALAPFRADFLGINCVPTANLDKALAALYATSSAALAAYGNIGETQFNPAWKNSRDFSPLEYREITNIWKSDRLKILGGCCGTSPEHIELLSSKEGKETT